MASSNDVDVGMGSSEASVFDLFGEDMVSIEVGLGAVNKRFMVHKALLCKRIPYFDKMFNGAFQEGVEQKASFPEDDIDAWGLLIGWVYSNKSSLRVFQAKNMVSLRAEMPKFIKGVGLAERYLIEPFADYLMETILRGCKYFKTTPVVSEFGLGYQHTAKGSKLRYFLARFFAFFVMRERYKDMVESLRRVGEAHPEILLDLFDILAQHAQKDGNILLRNPYLAPSCDYHQHSADVSCPWPQPFTARSCSKPEVEIIVSLST